MLLSSRTLSSFSRSCPLRALPSFPTRRSSDLALARDAALRDAHHVLGTGAGGVAEEQRGARATTQREQRGGGQHGERTQDRKSTRLNSSHLGISYAVFCLKKKKKKRRTKEKIK